MQHLFPRSARDRRLTGALAEGWHWCDPRRPSGETSVWEVPRPAQPRHGSAPQVSVDVFAYNSRKIYIIADGAGYGQQVIALPATGGETVLDAISRVQGLPAVASLKKIWVARPSPAGHPCSTVLPVD